MTAALPTVDDIDARARSQLNYVESGGRDGHSGNIVKYWPDDGWQQYQGQSWCAAFVTWLYLPWQAAGVRYLECNAGEGMFKKVDALRTDPKGIKKGDILFYHFPGEAAGANHTGWAAADADVARGTVLAIEGNTRADDGQGQTNGGGVYLKQRPLGLVHAYARMAYAPPTPPPTPPFVVQGGKGFVDAPSGPGGWVYAADGGVFSVGFAWFYGSLGGQQLPAPCVGMAATPTTRGYWLATGDGGVHPFGDAAKLDSLAGKPLAQPIVGIAATPDGHGCWLAAADGGVFALGNAPFFGSMGGTPLAAPVMAIRRTPTGRGYWLLARDGGVFAFGDAPGVGSMAGRPMAAPVVALVGTKTGLGYAVVGADGGVFNFGDAAWKPYVPLQAEYQRHERTVVGADLNHEGRLQLVSDHLETYTLQG